MSHSPQPLAVLPLTTAEAAPLSYAGALATIAPIQVKAARWLLALAVLSGLCVPSLAFSFTPIGQFANLLIFLSTLTVGLRTGILIRRHQAIPRALTLLDGSAAIALLTMSVAPFLRGQPSDNTDADLRIAMLPIGIAFALFALSTHRHRLLYSLLSGWSEAANRPRAAKGLRLLGNIKMVYEALWLLCCAAAALLLSLRNDGSAVTLASLALFGCAGYGIIWLWMILAHAFLAARLRKAQRPA